MGHDLGNCLPFAKWKAFLAHQQTNRGGVKLKAPTSEGHGGGAKLTHYHL